MLRELVVENLGVIERAEVDLGDGATALTGETGAGKTLIVSAMGLLLGERADRTLIRHGSQRARIQARFHVGSSHPALEALVGHGLADAVDDEIVIVREVAEGGGKVRINGHISTVATLSEISGHLVEVAGQHEHQRLSSRRHQLALLDSFAGAEAVALADEVADAVALAASAQRRAQQLEAGERDRIRELDVLRYEIDEISAVAPREGESDDLSLEATRLDNAEAIADSLVVARSFLEDEGGSADGIRAAIAALSRTASNDGRVAAALERLSALLIELEDVTRDLVGMTPTHDPVALEQTRQRLATLAKLRRKYGADEAAVLTYLATAQQRVADLETASSDVERAAQEAESHRCRAEELARRLSAIRGEAAARLGPAVTEVLTSLAMAGSRVEAVLETVPLYEGGLESAELKVGQGASPGRPIAKVASGGELSRIALALRLVAGGVRGFASTVVFDEVDAGVGGEAARAVGESLAALARRRGVQVLVVTHLPQVAAFADHHHLVTKIQDGDTTSSAVKMLDTEERVAELSRMLAGLPDSDRAKEHAQELLEVAART